MQKYWNMSNPLYTKVGKSFTPTSSGYREAAHVKRQDDHHWPLEDKALTNFPLLLARTPWLAKALGWSECKSWHPPEEDRKTKASRKIERGRQDIKGCKVARRATGTEAHPHWAAREEEARSKEICRRTQKTGRVGNHLKVAAIITSAVINSVATSAAQIINLSYKRLNQSDKWCFFLSKWTWCVLFLAVAQLAQRFQLASLAAVVAFHWVVSPKSSDTKTSVFCLQRRARIPHENKFEYANWVECY